MLHESLESHPVVTIQLIDNIWFATESHQLEMRFEVPAVVDFSSIWWGDAKILTTFPHSPLWVVRS